MIDNLNHKNFVDLEYYLSQMTKDKIGLYFS